MRITNWYRHFLIFYLLEVAIACGLYFVTDPEWEKDSWILRLMSLGGFFITVTLAAVMIGTMRVTRPMLYWQRWVPTAGLGIPAAVTFLILNLINSKERVIDHEDIIEGIKGGATIIVVHAVTCTIVAAAVKPKVIEENGPAQNE